MINLALFKKEIRENRGGLLLCITISSALALFIALSFQIDRRLSVELSALKLYGSLYQNFTCWIHWTAGLSAFTAIVLGMGVISGEEYFGTASFLLSKPLTRREAYTTKIVAGLFMLAVVLFGSAVIFILLLYARGISIDPGFFFTTVLIVYAGAAVIYMGTVIFSSIYNRPGIAGAVAVLFWAAASVPGCFPSSAPYSIFYQMRAIPYICHGQEPFIPLGTALVLGGICYESGFWLWSGQEF